MKTRPHATEKDAVLEDLGRLAHAHLDGEAPPDAHAAERDRLVFALRGRVAGAEARRRTVALWLMPAAAALAMAVVVWKMGWIAPRLTYSVDSALTPENGYMRLAERAAPAAIRFSDGSEVRLEPGAEVRVEEIDRRGARIALLRGGTSLSVVHREQTRWSVAAGPFVVRVTGTAFDVNWMSEEEKLVVTLRSGSVVVDGPLTRSGVRLAEGHRLEARLHEGRLVVESIDAARAAALEGAVSPAGAGAAPAAQTPAATEPVPSATRAPERSWAKRVGAGDYSGVVADAQTRGVDAVLAQAPLSDLVALADAARYTGEKQIARRALVAQRSRFAGSEDARAAAFLIGCMIQDSGGAGALEWFDRYLGESPRGPFSSEALGRKMIAVRKASGVADARPVAQAYLHKYPDGAYAAAAREIAAAP